LSKATFERLASVSGRTGDKACEVVGPAMGHADEEQRRYPVKGLAE
jgi:hypothetical protein